MGTKHNTSTNHPMNPLMVQVIPLEFPLSRVPASGEILARDHPRVREACDSGGDPAACEIVRLDFKIPTYERDPDA